MTQFIDGPAAGVTLMLRRAPLFLRAVQMPGGEWDALDQTDDYPKETETIVVYELHGPRINVHINARGGRSGFYQGGEYRLVDPQPADNEFRDVFKWRAWATAAAQQRGHRVTDSTTGAMQ